MLTRVYIAGPYTNGDVGANVFKAMLAWHELRAAGFAPFCPHLSHFLHIAYQLPYEEWTAQDLEWLTVCNAVLRLPGESPGADREVALAHKRGIPVYYSIADLEAAVRLRELIEKGLCHAASYPAPTPDNPPPAPVAGCVPTADGPGGLLQPPPQLDPDSAAARPGDTGGEGADSGNIVRRPLKDGPTRRSGYRGPSRGGGLRCTRRPTDTPGDSGNPL